MLYVLAVSLSSCGSEKGTQTITDYLTFPETRRQELVNQSSFSARTDLKTATSLVETDYGMKLSMFSDGKFYYNIDGIGEGAGLWTYNERGYFHLHANYIRSPSGLNFFVISLDEKGTVIDVVFDDRFGVQRKRVQVINEVKRKSKV